MFKQSKLIIVTFFISLALSSYAVYLFDQYNYQQKHISVRKIASAYVSHIRNDLNQALSATYSLGAFIRRQNGDMSGFSEFATEILYLYPGVASLQLHPKGIVKYIVPLEGNEDAIGHNLFLDPKRKKEVIETRDSGKLTLAGPFDLIQGGEGAVARLPIFLGTNKESESKNFWGFTAVLIKFPDILNGAELTKLVDAGIGYQLSRVHPDTGDLQVISTSNTPLIDDAELFRVDVPHGHWTFQAYPFEGWRDNTTLFFEFIVALLFVFLATFSSFLLTRLKLTNLQLEITVSKRTSALKTNYERLTKSDKKLDLSQKVAGIGTWEWNIEKNDVFWSEQMYQLLGYDSTSITLTDVDFFNVIHPDDRDAILNAINTSIELGKKYNIEHRVLWPDGQVRWLHAKGDVIRDENGKAISMLGVSVDTTEQKLIQDKLILSSRVFTNTHEGITITDCNKLIVDVNPAFCNITGFDREDVIGKNSSILNSSLQEPEFYRHIWKDIDQHEHWQGELWSHKKNGEVFAILLTLSALKDENKQIINYVGVFTDITRNKLQQEQLKRIAHYDLLTNLPNRVLLADRLSHAMLQCSRQKKSLAVVFLDLDGFKTINDEYGHHIGDKLLIELSLRMQKVTRAGDTLARFGGDEFVAVLTNLTDTEDCQIILKRFLLSTSEAITIDDLVLNISASIGVTFYPQDKVDADQLMRHADQAMYVAKQLGKNRYSIFDTTVEKAVKVQRESLDAIRSAIDNNQFELYYQPKVNMKSGTVVGFEALIRWQHPERGLLNPIAFLPIIENNSMSIEIGEWVINTALQQISQWQTMGVDFPVAISVNIAVVQLQQSNFVAKLATLLAKYPHIEPRLLELEVLETSALLDVQHVSNIMNECIALGVSFALDDFGTGYSSLTHLRRLPTCLIKIDQTFVRDMLVDSDDLSIIKGVIALAKSFKRDVIAEGVETIAHGTALITQGCDLAQGYGIARPMPANKIPVWVKEWRPAPEWQI